MKHPLIPAAALVALVILVCEGCFGLFGRLCDPSRDSDHYSHFVSEECFMLIRAISMPTEREKSIGVVAEVLEISDSTGTTHRCKGKIQLYFQKPASIAYGDEILILATPQKPSTAFNPHQFDYRRFLARKGILYTDYVTTAHFRITGHSEKGVMAKINRLRGRLLDVIHYSSLTPSQQGIAEALFLGWDGDLEPETQDNFKRAGITHLLCVSGLHVGILSLLTGYCLSFFSNRRRGRIAKGCIQITVIWMFVMLTGMAPGTTRAGLMFSLIAVGQMFFSKPPTLNAIAASALIMLVANPLLLFDVGFELSYCAVLGIVLFVRPLEELIPLPDGNSPWSKPLCFLLRKIRSLFCVSLVAQLSTLPLILYYFHQFPLYFLVANMVVIPFAGIILGSVIVMLAVAWWPWLFSIAGSVLSFELGCTEWVTGAVSSWPHSMIQNIWFDTPMLVLSFAMVALLGTTLLHRRWATATATLALAVATTVYAQSVESRCAKQRHFDVYNIGNRTAIEFFAGHQSYLVCDSNIAHDVHSIDFFTSDNIIYRQIRQRTILRLDTVYEDGNILVSDRFIGFSGRSFRIIDRSNYRQHSLSRPKVDYLLLRESPYISIYELQQQYSFDTLIITSANAASRREAWMQDCDSLGISVKAAPVF